jgi:hypothetical protein
MGRPCEVLDEHTGTTDDTHLLGTDGVDKRGDIVGVTITKAHSAIATVTIYDTNLADGAGAYATEEVLLGPYAVPASTVAQTPIYLDFGDAPVPFSHGIGADLSNGGLGVQIHWRT